jgi:hypothetical protein
MCTACQQYASNKQQPLDYNAAATNSTLCIVCRVGSACMYNRKRDTSPVYTAVFLYHYYSKYTLLLVHVVISVLSMVLLLPS